jgi:ATP-dependent 26S proteasome regulatory subunit
MGHYEIIIFNVVISLQQLLGLDDVLSQLKRRVWTPLAVPPRLLLELGIQPVRGVLLYGRPGCGKVSTSIHTSYLFL